MCKRYSLTSAKHQDRHVLGALVAAQQTAQLEAVHPGHQAVEQDERGRARQGHCQRLFTVGGVLDAIAMGFQDLPQELTPALLVVDYQDGLCHAASR
jgi:hypothetical protein